MRYEHTQIGYLTICVLFGAAICVAVTIKIDGETLAACFAMGLICKKVLLAEIIRIRWWYGWGIHLTPYGWLYNVAGWDAVAITLRNGRKFALGTDDPHGLVDAIRRLTTPRGI
jgi:hypothetical protein